MGRVKNGKGKKDRPHETSRSVGVNFSIPMHSFHFPTEIDFHPQLTFMNLYWILSEVCNFNLFLSITLDITLYCLLYLEQYHLFYVYCWWRLAVNLFVKSLCLSKIRKIIDLCIYMSMFLLYFQQIHLFRCLRKKL